MVKTPLEDFTTEILVGILMSNQEIADRFANDILKIEGSNFTFNTQECFYLADSENPDCRVDLVVRSENLICLLECKVESREGYLQLDRYSMVLDSLAGQYITHLKYCTKYYDSKNITKHDFHQFRWADIYRFLSGWKSSDIVNEFLKFLTEYDMSDNMDFTIADLLTLESLNSTIIKLERYIEKIQPIFVRYFGASRIKSSKNFGQIKVHSRFIFHADNILGETGYSEIGVGFDFEEAPSLVVWIWVSNNSKKEEFKTALKKSFLMTNGEDWLACKKPLSDFISSKKVEEEIEIWFSQAFDKIKAFILANPELNWKI